MGGHYTTLPISINMLKIPKMGLKQLVYIADVLFYDFIIIIIVFFV